MKYGTYIAIALCAALAIVAPVQTAQAGHDFVFQVTSGVWHNNNNWLNELDQPGTPTAADTAAIPSGKTCRVTAGNAAEALSIDVSSGATLRIEDSGTLELSDDSSLDGDLLFYSNATNCAGARLAGLPQLNIAADLSISGSGTIQAGCTGNLLPGKIVWVDEAHTLTISGSIHVYNVEEFTVVVSNGGTITQNLGGTTMTFFNDVTGSGDYEVSAGTMVMEEQAAGSGKLDVSGTGLLLLPFGSDWDWIGEVEMTGGGAEIDFDGTSDCLSASFNLHSGTLDLHKPLEQVGAYSLGGDGSDDLVIIMHENDLGGQDVKFGEVNNCN